MSTKEHDIDEDDLVEEEEDDEKEEIEEEKEIESADEGEEIEEEKEKLPTETKSKGKKAVDKDRLFKTFNVKGVRIKNEVIGFGRKARRGDLVALSYKGKLNPKKNKTFDETNLRHPMTFRLGAKRIISGINLGVAGMCLNGVRELVIPPKHGFGMKGLMKNGQCIVPKNATLYYDVRMVELTAKKQADVEKAKEKAEKQERLARKMKK